MPHEPKAHGAPLWGQPALAGEQIEIREAARSAELGDLCRVCRGDEPRYERLDPLANVHGAVYHRLESAAGCLSERRRGAAPIPRNHLGLQRQIGAVPTFPLASLWVTLGRSEGIVRRLVFTAASILLGCRKEPEVLPTRGQEPQVTPASASLRRLTGAEYQSSIADLFGDIVLPTSLEPDLDVNNSYSIGAAITAISPLGVERYEDAAWLIAEQVISDETLHASLVVCTPAGITDTSCAEQVIRPLGRRIWRRSLAEGEVAVLVGIADEAALALSSFDSGLVYALGAMLQSPHFLYRVELGAQGSFTDHEIASRMSFLLWGGPPDDELLDLADEGQLHDPASRRAQAERMLQDPRARRGLRTFFDDMLGLDALEGIPKDPDLFLHWSDTVAVAAREETLSVVEDLAFTGSDFRDWLTTRRTWLDRSLAALYEVPAPAREGFASATLPSDGPRRGLLGQASFLALQAHSVSTSVTRRGLFVRTVLLCQSIPPPPANVDTSIPEATASAPTMRERVAIHLEDPVCASCHQVTDPIGLAFEPFDGIGRHRTSEDGYPIDPSGDFDGESFDNAEQLVSMLRVHPDLTACLTSTLLEHAQGHVLSEGEAALHAWHDQGFAEQGHRLLDLLIDIVAADGFAAAGEAL